MHQVYARWSGLQASAAASAACDVAPRLLIMASPNTRIAGAALRAYPIALSFLLEYPPRTDPLIGLVRRPVPLVRLARIFRHSRALRDTSPIAVA